MSTFNSADPASHVIGYLGHRETGRLRTTESCGEDANIRSKLAMSYDLEAVSKQIPEPVLGNLHIRDRPTSYSCGDIGNIGSNCWKLVMSRGLKPFSKHISGQALGYLQIGAHSSMNFPRERVIFLRKWLCPIVQNVTPSISLVRFWSICRLVAFQWQDIPESTPICAQNRSEMAIS